MTLNEAIQEAKTLVASLSITQEERSALTTAIDNIEISASPTGQASPEIMTLDAKTGCYKIAGNTAHFCPHCFNKEQQQIATQRINSQLRICPQCRESIKSN
jgi:chaperonin cofactor prefoldin